MEGHALPVTLNETLSTRLIVNADDFGLTLGINRAIRELCQAGVLTSATLMANSAAFEDAATIALANPSLGVGCHIVLTDGTPASDPAAVPSLLGADGKHFRPKLSGLIQALLRGRISEEEIAREALAQVRKLQQAGIHPTHLDTHKHTHLFPQVARPLLRVAEANNIRAIRNPFEAPFARALGHGSFIRRAQIALLGRLSSSFHATPQIRSGTVHTTNGSAGISTTGALDAATLKKILNALPDGTWELVCHPGYNDSSLDTVTTRLRHHRDTEREALLTEIPYCLAQPNPPQLINYALIV